MTTAEDRQNAEKYLHNLIQPGQIIHTMLLHVSRSGMTREIAVIVARDGKGEYGILHPIPENISWAVAKVTDSRFGERGGVIVQGCGMDMGFHIVHNLAFALYPEKMKLGEHPILNQRWL